MNHHTDKTVYGPFYRLLAPTQTARTVLDQLSNGQIWGRAPSWNGPPAVKAHVGSIPDGDSGIEFWAFQAPDSPYGTRAFWRRPGPEVHLDDGGDLVKLNVAFVRITQDLRTLMS